MTSDTLRLVLVDDHMLVRRGLRDALGADPSLQVVAEAGSWDELLPLLDAVAIDVLVLDINLPGLSGLDILDQLSRRPGAPRVLVVSMYPEDQYAIKALKAGALGYVNKACEAAELVLAVHQVARGMRHLTPAVASLLVEQLQAPAQSLPHHRLTERERELLVLLARGERLPEIAQRLQVPPKVAGIYRARVMEKMKLATQAELAHYAQRHGLLEET
ncbi:response regulator [Ramlibacter sp. MAHUQ-53]|uniref:response regulator n=1 Tax=unclassified Ramlibacter TaxID=2617605 RepID=UPI00362D229F